jgi:hypothetical protein
MMGTEMVPETSVSSFRQLTRVIAREDFIEFPLRENFKSYMPGKCLVWERFGVLWVIILCTS